MAIRELSARPPRVQFKYDILRTVTSDQDNEVGRRRYAGIAPASSFFELSTDANVRDFLGRDEHGDRRKSTRVNMAIRNTLETDRESFSVLNAGITIVAREAKVDDNARKVALDAPSIINGAQTQGVVTDFFKEHPEDTEYPSMNFEIIVTDDEDLIGKISIARNFQNEVKSLSIYGREGRFNELEKAMQRHDKSIKLRKSETDFGDEYFDTEKLIQVLTAIAPTGIKLPSAEKRKVKTPETIYRVYAYRHRSRCLKDFADVMDDLNTWKDAASFFMDIAFDAWGLYQRLRGEQGFSPLHCVQGDEQGGRKKVRPDGVPDGVVFPLMSALSRFTKHSGGKWRLELPTRFPWGTFIQHAMTQATTTAGHNPQTMGKKQECYIALHGLVDMYFSSSATA